MKNHLKRIASPRTWMINRKESKFVVRPNTGAHSLDSGLPLGLILRDLLKLALTMGEIKKMLNNETVTVDGKRRKDHRFIVGLFDVISVPKLNKSYRVLLGNNSQLVLTEISAEESRIKLNKVVGKTLLPKGKVQFNLHDGKNIISKQEAKVGDTFVLSLPQLEVKKVLPLKAGMQVFLVKGKHAGDKGVLKKVEGTQAVYSMKDKQIETAKEYLFVVGEKKSEIGIDIN